MRSFSFAMFRALIALVFIFSAVETTQAQTGKIAGRVLEAGTGEPLPFVNIIIEGTSQGAASDIDGYYSILNVRPGTHSIKASAIGYNSQTITDVRVSIDLTTKADFELGETSLELGEDVVVVAEKPLVTKDLTASTALVGADQIASLPVTEFQEVLELQAGVVGGNVRGGRSGEVVYAIDGVPVTDGFDGSTVVDVSASSIQELQFISGAFNAEYGKALSGYVNLSTKEGDNSFTGSITTYFGDWVSSNDGIFRNIDNINPLAIRNIDGNLSGPVIPNSLWFYANARYIYFDGWLHGKRVYDPWNITSSLDPNAPLEERYEIEQTGNGEYFPMNYNEKVYLHGKLTWKPLTELKIAFTAINDRVRYRDYDHSFSYNPGGDFTKFRTGYTNILAFTHTLGSNTFYQASFSYFFKKFNQFVYSDLDNPYWTHSALLSQEPQESPSFKTGGTQLSRFKRITDNYGFKIDMTSQVTRVHQLKGGIEVNRNNVTFNNINPLMWKDRNGNGRFDQGEDGLTEPETSGDPFVLLRIPDVNSASENLAIDLYERQPIEFSAYIQDKIELEEMIINIGVRMDYFEPDGFILNDPTDPDIYRPRNPANIGKTLEQRKQYWYKEAEPKLKFSPRLGVAFPYAANSRIYFSYGHFFQVPNYSLLYSNPEYKFGYGTSNLGIAGNPDLKPEETISGEVGISQAVSDELTFDVTAYFRDIRNLTGTRADEIVIFGGSGKYSQFVNSDFGFVKGVILSVNKRFSNNWSATLDYTLQSAKGNASDPSATRNALAGGQQPEIQLVALNWDQSHTINATFNYASPNSWGFSLIGQYGSGFPYSPTQSLNVSELLTNSELKPSTFNVDLRAYYDFMFFDSYKINIFARVQNLFDIRNQTNVYNDSGTADFTLDEFLRRNDDNPEIINSLDEFYRVPTFYSEPRRIELGATLFF